MFQKLFAQFAFIGIIILILVPELSAQTNLKFSVSRNNYNLGKYTNKIASGGQTTEFDLDASGAITFELGIEWIIANQFGVYLSYQSTTFNSKKNVTFFNEDHEQSVKDSPFTLMFKGYLFNLSVTSHQVYLGIGQSFKSPSLKIKSLSSSRQYSNTAAHSTIDFGLGYEYVIETISIGVKGVLMEGTVKTSKIDDNNVVIETLADSSGFFFGFSLSLLF